MAHEVLIYQRNPAKSQMAHQHGAPSTRPVGAGQGIVQLYLGPNDIIRVATVRTSSRSKYEMQNLSSLK